MTIPQNFPKFTFAIGDYETQNGTVIHTHFERVYPTKTKNRIYYQVDGTLVFVYYGANPDFPAKNPSLVAVLTKEGQLSRLQYQGEQENINPTIESIEKMRELGEALINLLTTLHNGTYTFLPDEVTIIPV